jgi:hypothetical protein
MTAELTQVRDRGARWQFAAGCARATVFPPGGNRAVVVVTGALTVAALAATWLATGALLPPARVFALTCELGLRGVDLLDEGMIGYLLFYPPAILLAGSAVAAAAGRSFHTGIAACAWATMLGALLVIVAWLAEAPRWYRQLGGMLLDSDGGIGMGTNLGDAIWWTLPVLVLWALPLGVLGAAAGRRPIPTASGSTGSGRR